MGPKGYLSTVTFGPRISRTHFLIRDASGLLESGFGVGHRAFREFLGKTGLGKPHLKHDDY